MSDYLSEIDPMIQSAATEYARKYRRYMVERADLAQEITVWCLEHPGKIRDWLAQEEDGERKLARTLRRLALRHAQQLKEKHMGWSSNDTWYYSKGELKALVKAMFQVGDWTNPPMSEDGGRSNKAPSEGGNWIATLADVSRAFDQLSKDDRELLIAFHRDDYTNILMAEMHDTTEQQMSREHSRALERLCDLLGGEKPKEPHYFECSCERGPDQPHCECACGSVVGQRKILSNAAARAATDHNYEES